LVERARMGGEEQKLDMQEGGKLKGADVLWGTKEGWQQ
jgi:hypothetical protein